MRRTRARRPGFGMLRWAAVVAWMALIFYLSAQPSLPQLIDRWGGVQSLAGHFLEYAVLALLLHWALMASVPATNGLSAGRALYWAFGIALAFAVTDELHQRFVPGRSMDPVDLLVDAVGAAAGLCIALLARRRRTATRAINGPGTTGSL